MRGVGSVLLRLSRIAGEVPGECIIEVAPFVPAKDSFIESDRFWTNLEPGQQPCQLANRQWSVVPPFWPGPILAFHEMGDDLLRRKPIGPPIREQGSDVSEQLFSWRLFVRRLIGQGSGCLAGAVRPNSSDCFRDGEQRAPVVRRAIVKPSRKNRLG